jgi:hypothetical protein
MMLGLFALVIAAIFTGGAAYILVAEQPARLMLDDKALLIQWKPSYKRGFAMQAPLALLGFVCGLAAWYRENDFSFLIGALLMLANWPWTLIVIMPINNKLMRMEPVSGNSEARALIVKWSKLHAVRALLGAGAVMAFYAGCAFHRS